MSPPAGDTVRLISDALHTLMFRLTVRQTLLEGNIARRSSIALLVASSSIRSHQSPTAGGFINAGTDARKQAGTPRGHAPAGDSKVWPSYLLEAAALADICMHVSSNVVQSAKYWMAGLNRSHTLCPRLQCWSVFGASARRQPKRQRSRYFQKKASYVWLHCCNIPSSLELVYILVWDQWDLLAAIGRILSPRVTNPVVICL